MVNLKIAKRVDPNISHCKEKKCFCNYTKSWMLTFCGKHFAVNVCQVLMWYTLNYSTELCVSHISMKWGGGKPSQVWEQTIVQVLALLLKRHKALFSSLSLTCWSSLFSDPRTVKQLLLPNPCLCFPTTLEALFSPPGYCAWNSGYSLFRKEGGERSQLVSSLFTCYPLLLFNPPCLD